MLSKFAITPVLALIAAPAFAQDDQIKAGIYQFDPDHSQITFDYNHMGFSTSVGVINGVAGTIELDPADLTKASVVAQFPLSNLRTVSPKLDKHLQSADFFNSENAEISFRSTSIKLDDDDEAEITGDLTMNGVTKSIVLDVEFNKAGISPATKAFTLGFEAEGKIKRSDFGLAAFVPDVEDELEFDIAVEATKDE